MVSLCGGAGLTKWIASAKAISVRITSGHTPNARSRQDTYGILIGKRRRPCPPCGAPDGGFRSCSLFMLRESSGVAAAALSARAADIVAGSKRQAQQDERREHHQGDRFPQQAPRLLAGLLNELAGEALRVGSRRRALRVHGLDQ